MKIANSTIPKNSPVTKPGNVSKSIDRSPKIGLVSGLPMSQRNDNGKSIGLPRRLIR